MSHAEKVRKVLDLMAEVGVSEADLELYRHVEGFDYDLVNEDVDTVFDALKDSGVKSLWDHTTEDSYYPWSILNDTTNDLLNLFGALVDEAEE